jgi:hypothetical protein
LREQISQAEACGGRRFCGRSRRLRGLYRRLRNRRQAGRLIEREYKARPVTDVAAHLGHADASTTLKFYGFAIPKREAGAGLLDGLLP